MQNRGGDGIILKLKAFLEKGYRWAIFGVMGSSRTERNLERLYSKEQVEEAQKDFYCKKWILVLAIIVVGMVLGVAISKNMKESSPWTEEGILYRDTQRETQVDLVAEYEGEEYTLPIVVSTRRYTPEELEVLYQDFQAQLWVLIGAENPSSNLVTGPLLLAEEYEGYPFYVEWESDCPEVLSAGGEYQAVDAPKQVQLTAYLYYEGYENTCVQTIRVCPPVSNQHEWQRKELQQMLESSQRAVVEEDRWQLPSEWKGSPIQWKERKSGIGWKIFLCSVLLAVVVGYAKDKDLADLVRKRQQKLRDEYPGLLHQLILYVGAGMTIRNCFERILADYERSASNSCAAKDEIHRMLRELHAGASESRAYESLGRKVGVQEYIKLGTILSQNMKYGNRYLLDRLREEGDRVMEERLTEARKRGEEAGTKLIVPQTLLLAMVLVLILLPAFWRM